MNNDKEFRIPFSRKKLIGMISNLVFVTAIFLLIYILNWNSTSFLGIINRFITPVIFILLIAGIFVFIKSLRGNSPAIIINSEGIIHKTPSVSAGKIPWGEITKIYETRISTERLLTVQVKNPEKFIAQGNLFQRSIKRINSLISKSPIHISANILDIEFDELRDKIGEYHEKYGRA
jgi:hypothetical protein